MHICHYLMAKEIPVCKSRKILIYILFIRMKNMWTIFMYNYSMVIRSVITVSCNMISPSASFPVYDKG